MPTEPIRQSAVVQSAVVPPDSHPIELSRRHRLALARDIRCFEQALAAPAGDSGWRGQVKDRLAALRGSFTEHVVLTEGPAGLYTELLDQAPRLARDVRGLIREHGAVATALSALQRRVDGPGVSAQEVRGHAGDLLRELSRHRQRGADLVYEAYATDIGGET